MPSVFICSALIFCLIGIPQKQHKKGNPVNAGGSSLFFSFFVLHLFCSLLFFFFLVLFFFFYVFQKPSTKYTEYQLWKKKMDFDPLGRWFCLCLYVRAINETRTPYQYWRYTTKIKIGIRNNIITFLSNRKLNKINTIRTQWGGQRRGSKTTAKNIMQKMIRQTHKHTQTYAHGTGKNGTIQIAMEQEKNSNSGKGRKQIKFHFGVAFIMH